jgi:hypothetical protein
VFTPSLSQPPGHVPQSSRPIPNRFRRASILLLSHQPPPSLNPEDPSPPATSRSTGTYRPPGSLSFSCIGGCSGVQRTTAGRLEDERTTAGRLVTGWRRLGVAPSASKKVHRSPRGVPDGGRVPANIGDGGHFSPGRVTGPSGAGDRRGSGRGWWSAPRKYPSPLPP